ncbi:Rrf2 family transcriptional regulator [Allocoleopsis sp.]|uniref:RrF2 family transcriptional regulator n=1 Tax=Allocoleopsis sp. TaxID=3088169 RepID=UPI002FD18D0E
MELLAKSQYALFALLELAADYSSGEPLQIRQIAALHAIPNRYLEQQMAILKRGGLVKSIRGAKGGYVLARQPWKITILDALNCLEGLEPNVPVKRNMPDKPDSQVIQDIWQEARDVAHSALQRYTLQDLYERRKAKQQEGMMFYI